MCNTFHENAFLTTWAHEHDENEQQFLKNIDFRAWLQKMEFYKKYNFFIRNTFHEISVSPACERSHSIKVMPIVQIRRYLDIQRRYPLNNRMYTDTLVTDGSWWLKLSFERWSFILCKCSCAASGLSELSIITVVNHIKLKSWTLIAVFRTRSEVAIVKCFDKFYYFADDSLIRHFKNFFFFNSRGHQKVQLSYMPRSISKNRRMDNNVMNTFPY